eukprot:TRINITY_DN814_c0_g2_i2.p1 TRINITY_DN814_c0_g2~~TRINITY_DN814_c0_g2_i2.p1  ORF type:complete len:133 (+),score=2.56 TRINITY_DN814_c0_g2_i2:168-566(+)
MDASTALSSNSPLRPGMLVLLRELHPSSRYCKPGASLRVTGRLLSYDAETAMAVIADGGSSIRVDTQHLRCVPLRISSLFQFIGELQIPATSSPQMVLLARVGRNVDGLDLDLYEKALQLRRQFERKQGLSK